MLSIVKLLIFIVTTTIWYLLFLLLTKQRSKSIFPIIYVSFVSLFLYICGLLNILKYGAYSVIAIGIILFIIKIKDIIKIDIKKAFFNYQMLFLLICVIWGYFSTINIGIAHNDDYSHWYRICKMISYENALPTNIDLIFKSYPPGSAMWIYFVTKFIGFGPQCCFIAQDLIIFSCCLSIFLIFDDERVKLLQFCFVLIGSIIICSLDTTFYVLLVDSLVGLIPLTAYIIITKKIEHSYWYILIICSYLALIKTPAIIFCVVTALLYLTHNKNEKIKSLLLVVVPFITQYLYSIRNNIVYGNVSESVHAFSINRFVTTYNAKGSELISKIVNNFFRVLTNIIGGDYQIKIIWMSLIILLIIYFINKTKHNVSLFILCLFSFIVYSAGLLFVYIFSMSSNEAINLACFYRYMGTEAIYVFGIAFCELLLIINTNRKICSIFMCLSILIAILFGNYKFMYSHYIEEGYTDEIWQDMQSLTDEVYEYNTRNIFAVMDYSDYASQYVSLNESILPCYFRTIYTYGLGIHEIKNGDFSEWYKEQLNSCEVLFSFGDYTKHLPLIKQYINIENYYPGFSNIIH